MISSIVETFRRIIRKRLLSLQALEFLQFQLPVEKKVQLRA